MKVAILNISIGKYVMFWEQFYLSCENNFLIDAAKDYFVFTDEKNLKFKNNENVHIYHQENMGWPFNTMKRYHLFSKIANDICDYTYIFYINANALFVKPLTTKFLNPRKNLITVQHPINYKLPVNKYPYERNPKSNAYICQGDGNFYVQGAFVGGKGKQFIQMAKTLDTLTEDDLKRNIVAIWHDESFLNMYVVKHNDEFQILGRQYLYYEEYTFPYEPVMMLRNKQKKMTLSSIRGIEGKKHINIGKMIMNIKNLKNIVCIKLGVYKKLRYIDENENYVDNDINIIIKDK